MEIVENRFKTLKGNVLTTKQVLKIETLPKRKDFVARAEKAWQKYTASNNREPQDE